MKTLLLFSLTYFSFLPLKQEAPKAEVQIEGNPSCIQVNKEYTFSVKIKDEKLKDFVVVSAFGAKLKNSGQYLTYSFSTSGGIDEININVGYKDQTTGKVNSLGKFAYEVCSE